MNTVVASVIVLVVVFAGLAASVLMFQRLRRMLGDRAFRQVPDKLTLKPRTGAWKDTILMRTLSSPLAARGFVDVGSFTAPELPGVSIRLLLQQEDNVLASIYEHAKAGHWIEIATFFMDGTSITYSTSRRPSSRPGRATFA